MTTVAFNRFVRRHIRNALRGDRAALRTAVKRCRVIWDALIISQNFSSEYVDIDGERKPAMPHMQPLEMERQVLHMGDKQHEYYSMYAKLIGNGTKFNFRDVDPRTGATFSTLLPEAHLHEEDDNQPELVFESKGNWFHGAMTLAIHPALWKFRLRSTDE